MAATDQQVQQYANERLRPRAEATRKLFNQLRDDKASIADVYDRANSGPWADDRTDGPPRLLTQQDILVYNAVISNLIALIDGEEEGTQQQIEQQRSALVAGIRDNWNVFQSACVRPVE